MTQPFPHFRPRESGGIPRNAEMPEDDEEPLVLATDFGTTFTAVAFVRRRAEKREKVKVITNYPGDARTELGNASPQVPTEAWYPKKSQLEADALKHETPAPGASQYSEMYADDESEQDSDDQAGNKRAEKRPASSPTQEMLWGYEVKQLVRPDADLSGYHRFARFKLLLDTSKETESVRTELLKLLSKLDKTAETVIAEYLTELFIHVKEQLYTLYRVPPTLAIEHVMSVPVIWNAKGCRTMQSAFETAIRDSDLGTSQGLFFVSEPEAATGYIFDKYKDILPGESFLMIDAGGGTVDATAYELKQDRPIRLSAELVKPAGCVHGSSCLNEDFRKLLTERLANERADIEHHGATLEGLVDCAVLEFEKSTKRNLDVTQAKRFVMKDIRIAGLRKDEKKRFRENRLDLNLDDFRRVFTPHLRGIQNLMIAQLLAAKEVGYKIKKVVLIGGFSASISLRGHLTRVLKDTSKEWGYQIRLTESSERMDLGEAETAVAYGAVLRALDKKDGPKRISQCSYGFDRTEPYEPEEVPAHRDVSNRWIIDPDDGQKYIPHTIEWLICKGQQIPSHRRLLLPVTHTIPTKYKRLLCDEILYVSDECTESHYRNDHPKNAGKWEIAGTITADMTSLRKQLPVEKGPSGRYYKIDFDLVVIVDGRNLKYEVRWPGGGNGQVQVRGESSIAATFKPGTK